MMYQYLMKDVEKEYKDKNCRKIAQIALDLGEQWTNIVSVSKHLDLKDRKRKKQYKKECAKYIKANFDKSQFAGSFFVALILPFLIKIVVNWIASLIIDSLFNDR